MHQRKKQKTLLSLTGIVLSMTFVAIGCGKLSDGVEAVKPEANDKRIEITWANNFSAPEADDNYVQMQLEQKFKVKIKNVKFERQGWKDKFNILLASGQIPDIFPIDANETDMATWAAATTVLVFAGTRLPHRADSRRMCKTMPTSSVSSTA